MKGENHDISTAQLQVLKEWKRIACDIFQQLCKISAIRCIKTR